MPGPCEEVKGNPYGYCPWCGAAVASRERRPNGNDRCANGHTYPSADSVKDPPARKGEERRPD